MILAFPDADTLRLAFTSGVVPADVALAPATAGTDAAGRLVVDTAVKLPKKAANELGRLGVVGVNRLPADARPVTCWPQLLPLEKLPGTPQLAAAAPVLFEVPSAEELAAVVGEMLRLGNDRQSFRWVEPADGGPPRALLRVVGPPYYTLLRAIDRTTPGLVAYAEQAPRVWVQVGYSHPLAAQLAPADGQSLLLRAPADWTPVADAPFRDVYDILRFELPGDRVDWAEAAVEEKLAVPLRLVAGNAADAAELWVLRGSAADGLDEFVRDADERITQRLKFAVGTSPAGETVVVLRTTPSKLAPPPLQLPGAVGYKPFWKLPNLFVPAGTRLHPTLRRDAVRKLLADDTDRLTWLAPDGNGGFTPETLPEDSFRPLEDWVDYVVETHHAPLAEWVEASRFDFDHFICSDTQPPKPRDGDKPKGKRPARGDEADPPPAAKPAAKPPGDAAVAPAAELPPAAVEVKPKGEWELRRKELEQRFLAVEGPLDDPGRVALWPELAEANTGYGDTAEAAVCWANAIWEPAAPPREWLTRWVRAEFPSMPLPVPAAEFDRAMQPADPTPGQLRQFAALFLAVAHADPVPGWLSARLPAVQRYAEANERKLPIRLAWLVGSRLAQLAGADVLGLARVRDRLLQRLLEDGLNPERDLPSFLRYAGLKDSDRVRLVRDRALELHRLARGWAEKGVKATGAGGATDGGATLAYFDLLFAYGLAKLGEGEQAKGLVESAKAVLAPPAPRGQDGTAQTRGVVGPFLLTAFAARVEQALGGKPAGGRLPGPLYDELDRIRDAGKGQMNSPHGMAHYVVNRLREQSRVLEPQEKSDPYAEFLRHSNDPLRLALSDLLRERDPGLLTKKLRDLYRTGAGTGSTPETRLLVLLEGLPLAARVGEAFTVELLGLVPEAMAAGSDKAGPVADLPKKQGQLLERALFLAAHFDRREIVARLVDQFVALVKAKKQDEQRFELVNVVAGQCLRSLRKLGLRDDIDRLLRRLQDEVLKGQTADKLRAAHAGKPDAWAKALQTLLNLAGGWLTFGLVDQATPILDDARSELLAAGGSKVPLLEYTRLAQAYVAAVGQGPADQGLARIAELFRKMDPGKVTNGFTTAPYYSRLHLNIVEEVVLAVVSDDFALGPVGRRWLDEDEYLVRRRIHRDMKRQLAGSGL